MEYYNYKNRDEVAATPQVNWNAISDGLRKTLSDQEATRQAKRNELDKQTQETINNIVGFYWREVRKNLSSLKHSRVHITNLGDFVTKHWKIDSKIEMLEKFEENNRQKGLQQMTARFKTVETLFDLKSPIAFVLAF